MTLTVKEVTDGVLHVQARSQFDITSTFMRLQEFYESPFDEVRGRVFSHEEYIDLYAHNKKRRGTDDVVFSYFEDWHGFNVPGNVFNRWVKRFKKVGLWEKEKALIKLVQDVVGKRTNKFYVIGTFIDEEADERASVINHELSHAWYYLDDEYRTEAQKLLRKVPKQARYQMNEWLKSKGYDKSVFVDESIAYLSTDSMIDLDDMLTPVPWNRILKLQELFAETREKKLDEMEDDED